MVVLALVAGLLAAGGSVAAAPVCDPLVRAARWDAGTLVVRPSRCGRTIAVTEPGRVLDAAVAIAGGGATKTLRDQLRCHAVFAGFKRDWNLESYRPVVSWPDLIATACNPPPAG